jgi:UDP-glucose 4-epimerase
MGRIYNMGSGTGVTVLEVLRACEEAIGRKIPYEIVDRRPGDPGVLVATPEKIIRELGWSPRYGEIRDIVRTAWNWHRDHATGYRPSKP